ncbi:MAG: polysaccharide deacetylase family protein [Lachnospiraceae bacterium]|nr:polysaccharide deacetylase family protein [Lachnospiraceae bacterium]
MGIEEIVDFCQSNDKVYCYGAGVYGRIIRAYLDELGIELEGFIVSKIKKLQEMLGVPVLAFDGYKKQKAKGEGIIIGVHSEIQKEIVQILEENDITNYICVEEQNILEMKAKGKFEREYPGEKMIFALCYHRVVDIPLDTWNLAVKPTLFEQEINYLKNNYTILRAEDHWNYPMDNDAVIITFDDGYEDAYTNVLPIIDKYSIPATVFVSTGNIDTTDEFWWDELERIIFGTRNNKVLNEFNMHIPIMTREDKIRACYLLHPHVKKMTCEERNIYLHQLSKKLGRIEERSYCHSLSSSQLRQLAGSPFITIGGHTVTHSCLAYETLEEQEWEIKQSKEEIERIIGRKIEVFSYPFGQKCDFTDDTVKIAVECGYTKIYAAFAGLVDSEYTNGYIPRINAGQEKNFEDFVKMLRLNKIMYGK